MQYYRLGAVTLSAFAAMPAAARADIIVGATGLNQNIAVNSTYDLNINGINSFAITNSFFFAGSDYYGNGYYDKSVALAGLGASKVGSPVAAGIVASSPGYASENLASQFANFYSGQVGSQIVGFGSCGKNCSYPIYGPVYGTLASYSTSGQTGELFVPVSILSGGKTELGFLDLTITNYGTNQPYGVTLNGYEFDASGGAFAAGTALTPAVPEPSTWALMALGFVGLGLYRARAGRKTMASA